MIDVKMGGQKKGECRCVNNVTLRKRNGQKKLTMKLPTTPRNSCCCNNGTVRAKARLRRSDNSHILEEVRWCLLADISL